MGRKKGRISKTTRLWSFKRGWNQLRQYEILPCRKQLMEAMNVSSQAGFLVRLKGHIEPKVSEYNEINRIFSEYGIEDVWDNEI